MKPKSLVFVFVAFLMFQACKKKSVADFNSDFSLFKEYLTDFTSGIIPAKSDIRVVLAFEKKQLKPGPLDNDLFDISPSVDGKVVALSANTIAFVPDKKLEQDKEYQVTFHLSKLIETPKNLEDFKFTVKAIKQDFIVSTNDIQSYSKQYQYLNGVFKTADEMDPATVAKILSAEQKGKKLAVRIDKELSTKTEFKFIIDSIQRFDEDSEIYIKYDGNDFDIRQKGVISYPIAGRDHFMIMKVEVPEGENQTMLINFSEALQRGQVFDGLIAVENAKTMTFATEGNVLKVFFDEPLKGNLLLEVFQGIQSEDGYKLKENFATKVSFDQIKPNVRFTKNGTIMPSSNNLKLNFEAVNLSAVDVKVYKIFKNNILQFLQYNDLNGGQDLKRVAQPVAKTVLDLKKNNIANLAKWNTYALDLSKIITPEPGAIYRVEFSFRKKYVLYDCEGSEEEGMPESEEEEEEVNENDVNYSDNYYDDYYYDDYEWRQEQDPCSRSYYYNTRIITNILATDLGVIAKRGNNKSYFFAVNNIVTTEPVCDATVQIYNFQQQKIGEAKTNADGTVGFVKDKFAYFAIVSKGNQSTYIKLDDGNSLSVSNFDVSGEELQKGLKGYIYGERGVWRPGDNLYLSFMLNDAANRLPKSHPIKFRLTDPRGKITFQDVKKSNDKNHYVFVVPTNADAPTGNWEAMVSVGGARFYKSIKIETIKPNRLRIKATFDSPVLTSAVPNNLNLDVTWLHGAVAKNLKVDVQAKFSQQGTTFKGYDKYTFDDVVRKFGTEEINVFSGKTDAYGNAKATINPQLTGQAPGMLKAAFITKVYEEGGDVSTDVMSTTYSPYKTYVGIKSPTPTKYGMLETRAMNRFDIVTVDEKGRPKSVKNLQVSVMKTEWRWWWDASEDNYSNFNSSNATTSYKNFIISTDANGKGSVQFSVPDEDWGRYLIRAIDPTDGHASAETVLIDYPMWSGKTRNTDATTANMLVFSTDKKKYAVGETAKVSFPSSAGGRALISIENGSRVVQTYWAQTKKGETAFEVPITSAMAPNVFMNITLLQPHATTKNDSPIRMYGIVPIEVIDKATILEPKLTMPDVLKPQQAFNLKVSEKTGRAMTYTVAIVDEGLLDLTRFKTPNAWDNFYTREALGVKTWDIYDNVIGAYGGKVNQIFSIGGDQELGGGKAKKANRFKPVVLYYGPFTLAKGETRTHKIMLPKYIGSVRTMVVAGDAAASAYGSTEKATPVRSPLMVLASMPRKITPSEKVTVPVTVFAMEKNVKNVSVKISVNNALRIVGSNTQTISFNQPDEKLAYFSLEAGSATGIGKMTVTATSGKEKSTYDVEIDVMNPNPITNTFKDAILKPGKSNTISWTTFGVSGSNRAQVEISSVPTIDFNRRLQYLIEYPHGCVEQTTSAVFPQLYLNDVVDIDAAKLQSIQRNVKAGISRLSGFQQANGGFSYWPGNGQADDWGSSYAGHFLIEAEKKGFVLPISFKNKWIDYQKKESKAWRFNAQWGNDFSQAYRLYTLALAGSADLASMNRLRETEGISNESKLRLAAAYALAGQKSAGQSLLAKSKIDDDDNDYRYYYYGSAERNRAMALETLVLLGQKEKAFTMATRLAKDLSAPQWMSTQTTAYGLYAMSKFAVSNGGSGMDIIITQDGKSEAVKTSKAIANRKLAVKMGTNGITIKNNKNNTLFVRVLNSGILPVGKELAEQHDVAASMVFKNRKGVPVNVTKITQGTEFIAEVTVTNKRNEYVSNIALSQILPSGFEIVNTRFTDFGDTTVNPADYIDIRDDRTNFYFGLKANETKTFRILLNASYLGAYYLPGLQCEAMYDNTFMARTKGFWVEVVK